MDIKANLSKEETILCKLMEKYGSDKGCTSTKPDNFHNYTLYYNNLFTPVRYENLRIFELGIGTTNTNIPNNMGINGKAGASLRAWKEFFSASDIFAADIDKTILVDEPSIKTYYCDQTSKESIRELWTTNVDLWNGFDIIIDDALHTFDSNKLFFENSIHKLNINGVFIIEDLGTFHSSIYTNQMNTWKSVYVNLEFRHISYLEFNHKTNIYDNEMIIAKRIY